MMRNRIRELIAVLQRANEAYYASSHEIMSDREYDALYDELRKLEEQSGIIYADSPTQKVGYGAVDYLPKEAHEKPMLSLEKTKDLEELKAFTAKESLLSWKLDGLTIVLTYANGLLSKAVTRGNGEIGEVITNNAKVFANLPQKIPFSGKLVLRGEAVIRYSDFERINLELPAELQYKNPRNLCSGTVRQLNNEITAKRRVYFYAFTVVTADNQSFLYKEDGLRFLSDNGFEVVDYEKVTPETLEDAVYRFEKKIPKNPFTTDGLVLTINDIAYSEGLGRTSKFPKDSIAFKWKDEIRETTLLNVEWSVSRTGLMNPIAVFTPVEIEGTIVRRASLHNVSTVESLELGIGDTIEVYKANMIIPQIADNLTRSGSLLLPDQCPVCHHQTFLKESNDVKTMLCANVNCPTKKLKALEHFVSRDGFNIEGFSGATLEKMIQKGLIFHFADIFKLHLHADELMSMEGFGKKSVDNLLAAIEKSRQIAVGNCIYALGIANIGLRNAKLLAKTMDDNWERILHASTEEIEAIDGFGKVIAQSLVEYFSDSDNRKELELLRSEIKLITAEKGVSHSFFAGKSFVITGSLTQFENRNQCKNWIEGNGGIVAGSVSKNTDYLINNDVSSSSTKNKKAKELGIPILTEAELLQKAEDIE